MAEKLDAPAIRFKGFTDAWEQCELGDVATVITRTDSESIAPVMMISAASGFINQSEKYSSDNAGQSLAKYILLKKGELAYNHGASKYRKYGSCFDLKEDEARIPFVYHCFEVRNNNPDFIARELNDPRIDKQLKRLVSSGARMDGLLNISFAAYKTVTISVPYNEEQDKISEFLQELDNLITFHQRKQIKLKNIKKAMLEKMFPQNGSNVPEIRFAGFADPWEQRKVDDECKIIAGGTPSTQIEVYWNPKEIPWLSSGEVNKKRIRATDDMISKQGLLNSSTKWVRKNSVIIALAGQGKTRGTVAINYIPLTTNQSLAAMLPNKDLSYEFLFQNLDGRYDEIRGMSSADGSRGGLNKQIVTDIPIPYTCNEEQIMIGDFLHTMDNLITLHQRKLEKLQNVKKAFLEKMFV